MTMYYLLIPLILLHEYGDAALIAAAVASNRPDYEAWLSNISMISGCARGTVLRNLSVLEAHGYLARVGCGWVATEKYDSLRKQEAIRLPKFISSMHGISPAQKIIIGYMLTYNIHSMEDMQLVLGFTESKIRCAITKLKKMGYIEQISGGRGRGNFSQYKVLLPVPDSTDVHTEDQPATIFPQTTHDGIEMYEYDDALSEMKMRFADVSHFDIDPDILDAGTTGWARFISKPPYAIEIHGVVHSYSDIMMFEEFVDLYTLERVNKRIRELRSKGVRISDLESYVTKALLREAHDTAVELNIPTRMHPHTIPF